MARTASVDQRTCAEGSGGKVCNVKAAIGVDAIPAVAIGGQSPIVPDQFTHAGRASLVAHTHRIHEINGDTPGSPQNLSTCTGPIHNSLPLVGQCLGMPVAQPVHVIEEHESRQGAGMLA